MVALNNEWDALLAEEFKSEYYLKLRAFLKREYSTKTVYPHMNDIFNALRYTSFSDVKAVILGQDPYHGAGQAHGLAFSVREGVQPPPSLQNIYKELHDDVGVPIPRTGCLEAWARQGVLLLNTVLTVRAGEAFSHRGMGWEVFTDKVIKLLCERETPVIFMLWGRPAQEKIPAIDTAKHYILTAPHPSPLSASRGFFGCGHFGKANEFLTNLGQKPIEWAI